MCQADNSRFSCLHEISGWESIVSRRTMKKIRLPLDAYREPHAWHIIFHSAAGERPFMDEDLIENNLDILRTTADRYYLRIYAYCFMSNHLHLLVTNEFGDDIVQFVRHFKQLTAFSYRKSKKEALWQARFYDRSLESSGEIQTVFDYILGNPQAAGFDADEERVRIGSFEFDIE